MDKGLPCNIIAIVAGQCISGPAKWLLCIIFFYTAGGTVQLLIQMSSCCNYKSRTERRNEVQSGIYSLQETKTNNADKFYCPTKKTALQNSCFPFCQNNRNNTSSARMTILPSLYSCTPKSSPSFISLFSLLPAKPAA